MRSWFSWTFYAHLPLVATAHLSVVTWNILAPEFATPTKYPWASADALAWPSRQERILLKLAEIDADIVCLQEVGVAQWDELCGRLHTLGYDGILQEMSRGHPIANAILLRRGHVELLRAESRSRALIAVVRACGGTASKPQPLYLANVHLEAGAEKSATRLSQLRSLLRRIELQCSVNIAAEVRAPMSSVDGARSPVAIVGDFNSDRSSDVHELLSSHGNKARSADKRRLLSNPLLPLRDAYSDHPPPWGPSLKSSYRNGRLLDFIWTSSSVSVRPWLFR